MKDFENWWKTEGIRLLRWSENKDAAKSVWEAAAKHQDALIAAAYEIAAKDCEKAFLTLNVGTVPITQHLAHLIRLNTPSDSKAALRELCLRVAKEVFSTCAPFGFLPSPNSVDETTELEAIVDEVLGK